MVNQVCIYCRTGVMELVGSTWHCRCGAWVHEEDLEAEVRLCPDPRCPIDSECLRRLDCADG